MLGFQRRRLSINVILMAAFSLVITVMIFFMGFAISLNMEKSILETSTNSSEQLVSQTQFTLNKFFNRVNASLQSLTQNTALVEMCKYSVGDFNSNNLENREQVKKEILGLLRNQDDIANIIVLGDGFSVFHTDINQAPLMKSSLIQDLLHSINTQEHAEITYHPIGFPTYYNPNSTQLEIPVSLMVRDYSKYDPTNYGVILASLKVKTLDDFFAQMKPESGYTAFILDDSKRIYYSSKADWIGKDYGEYLYSCGVVSQNNMYLLDSSGNTALLETAREMDLNKWTIVLTSDLSSVQTQVNSMKFTVFCAAAITLLLILSLGYSLTRKITSPLAVLSEQMEKMDYQALSQKMENHYTYKEIGRLYDGYNHMLDRIESLINDVYYEQLRQKDAQYEALQAKINPHFLYNTLQSISSLAILNRNDDIEVVTSALGGMLEYLTYEKSSQVLLSQEVDYIKRYVQIQQLRYNNKFIVGYEISPDSLSCRINKLLLQPLVENAIKHGLEPLQTNGRLILRTAVQNKLLSIEVEDNGYGMDEETLAHLMKRINSSNRDSSQKSIGLSNVQERIHLKYGSQYGITIHSAQMQGTTVKITMPAVFSEPGGGTQIEKTPID